MPTFPTSATREVRSGDNCDLNGNPASQWQKFAGGRNPNLLRSLRALRSAMETNLNSNNKSAETLLCETRPQRNIAATMLRACGNIHRYRTAYVFHKTSDTMWCYDSGDRYRRSVQTFPMSSGLSTKSRFIYTLRI